MLHLNVTTGFVAVRIWTPEYKNDTTQMQKKKREKSSQTEICYNNNDHSSRNNNSSKKINHEICGDVDV